MEKSDRNKIDRSVDKIIKKLDMEKLWPKLFENRIFYDDDPNVPEWKENLNNPVVMRDILLKVKTRGPDAYENLIRSLYETNQHELIRILENRSNSPTYDDKENRIAYDPTVSQEPFKVRVIKSTEFYDEIRSGDPVDKYPMRSCPRGMVLIITLIDYSGYHHVRSSAERDEENLIDLFQQMGFKVYTSRNLTAAEIREKLKAFSQNEELRKVDSSFVVISGHGDRTPSGDDNIVKGIDHWGRTSEPDHEITYGEIISYFTAENCPNMINKPKVFIFQLCRGSLLQTVVPNGNSGVDNPILNFNLDGGDNKFAFDRDTNSSVRNYSDIIIANSTLPDNVSYRDTKNGSWFIQTICEVFSLYACVTHVSNLFDSVDTRLRNLRTENYGQTSVIKKIGFRHCYINPGLFEKDD